MGKHRAPGGCGSIPRELTSDQAEQAETLGSVHAGQGRRTRRWHKLRGSISLNTRLRPRQAATRLIGTTPAISVLTVPQNFAHSFIIAARLVNCVPR